ncbi:MAG TPA: acyl-CoA desaturase, partial [Thermoleophilaceae bacterium]|nr:acyl-CoA desaturase [Thermoleophilaceae bacterium]
MPSWRDGESHKRARCREQNEATAEAAEGAFRCECGDRSCACTIAMTPGEYSAVRGYPTHFAVTRNHENPESEQVIEERPGFSVVETVAGDATKLARRGDPRQRRRDARWTEPPAPKAPETVPIEHETTERVVRTVVLALPLAALVAGGWLAWGGALRWHDLVVLAVTYTVTGLGITVGYHRLFTHRSFKTTRVVRAALAVLGSMAVEGPVTEWVATHRKHHQFSDQEGDPHSPHTDHEPGFRGTVRGLVHAHVGWMFRGRDMANPARYAKDLQGDRDLRFISRTFPLWVAVGMAIPFGLGV